MRTVDDDAGTRWTIYAVSPDELSFGRRELLPIAFREGWLVFECAGERRRLAPVPAHWAGLTDVALRQMIGSAALVAARTARVPMSLGDPPTASSGTESPANI
ncbi:MAG TPA: hypothetical protein VH277_02845 [Gemmatimonadaceae bacterium]|jgi:hypothetical protein|nr:hypothetical protein [Gemmatimonadaceae bacterium]